MKKQQYSLNDFASKQISNDKATQIKGGHADVRRPSTTTTTGIWDDLEVRKVESPFISGDFGIFRDSRR